MGERINKEMAKRVWDRVQATPKEQPVLPMQHTDTLQSLIVEEWQQAQCYDGLSRKLAGRHKTVMQELYREKKAQIACLKGICTMCSGTAANIRAVQPVMGETSKMLRQCYSRQLRCLARYEAAANDGEYGPVYKGMADQNRRHCRILLEILGDMKE